MNDDDDYLRLQGETFWFSFPASMKEEEPLHVSQMDAVMSLS